MTSSSSHPAAFDGPVMCTDCLESSYSIDHDYLAHGLDSARGAEYQQQLAPPPYSHHHPEEQRTTGSHGAPLCNGSPHEVRRAVQGTAFPKNHNTIQPSQEDRKGTVICEDVKCTFMT